MLHGREIEVKFRVQNPDEIRAFIEKTWKIKGKKQKIYDIYFDTPTLELIKDSIAIRARAIEIEGEHKTYYITYKRKLGNEGNIMHREEIESPIDPDIYRSLQLSDFIEFEMEGVKKRVSPIIGIESLRIEYELEGARITIDEVRFSEELVEFFLEIEGEEEKIKEIRSILEERFHLEPLNLSKLELGLRYSGLN